MNIKSKEEVEYMAIVCFSIPKGTAVDMRDFVQTALDSFARNTGINANHRIILVFEVKEDRCKHCHQPYVI